MRSSSYRRNLVITAFTLATLFSSCASTSKNRPKLSSMHGRKVAVVEIDGEVSQRKIIEVALVNQISRHGTFHLISKEQIDHAKTKVGVDGNNWNQVANEVGADLALKITVLDFNANIEEGVSSEMKYDEVLAQERGEKEGTAEHFYKVRELTGTVKLELAFFNSRTPDAPPEIGFAEHQDVVRVEGNKEAIHLPPKMRFLEKIANQAFADFFEEYR